MTGFLISWLPLSARHTLLTLAVLFAGLTAAVLSHPHLAARVAVALTPSAAPAIDDSTATTHWPRAAIQLWILVPQILPRDP